MKFKLIDGNYSIIDTEHVFYQSTNTEEFKKFVLDRCEDNDKLWGLWDEKLDLFLEKFKPGVVIYGFSTFNKGSKLGIAGYILVENDTIINYIPII